MGSPSEGPMVSLAQAAARMQTDRKAAVRPTKKEFRRCNIGTSVQRARPLADRPTGTCLQLALGRRSKGQISKRRKRNEFAITDTELKLMAAAAMTGLRSKPKTG